MNIKTKASLRNEFTLERRKAIFKPDGSWEPGELVQEAKAHNIMTNRGLNTAAYHFGNRRGSVGDGPGKIFAHDSTTNQDNLRIGGVVQVGDGDGTLDPTRTTLFNRLAGYVTSYHAKDYGDTWASYTMVYTIQPEQLVGENITELGLSPVLSGNISSHAFLEDSEGNPISITNKTDLEVVIIYATVYIAISNFAGNVDYPTGLENVFLSSVYNNRAMSDNSDNINRISIGSSNQEFVSGGAEANGVYTLVANKSDTANTSASVGVLEFYERFGTTTGNDQKIWEIGLGTRNGASWNSDDAKNVFRCRFPTAGIYAGHTITDELLGTADGTQTVFTAAWDDWNDTANVIKVDGAEVTTGFTIDKSAGTVTFDTAPASGEVKGTYGVDYIPKDEQHVIDIAFEIHFVDANA